MSGLVYTSTCRLCGFTATHHQLVHLIKHNMMQAAKVFNGLKEHHEKKHKVEDTKAQLLASQYLGLLRIQHYESQDESAVQLRDYTRWQLRETLQKNRVPDEKLKQQVEALELPAELVPRVLQCATMLRDICEERGTFAPIDPAAAPENPASKNGTVVLSQ